MANRAEVLENLKKAASEGNIREAYRDFEELPFIDQVTISVSPGIGDALAAFEVGEFSARGAKNIKDKDFLGATGNYALAGLSFASLYPLLRLFRGAKALKAIDPVVDTPALPAKIETAKVVEEAVKDVPVPKVEEFKPLSLDEMTYPGTKTKDLGLTSKAAKFINTNKKLPNQGKAIGYINALEKAGVPKGELRLLNLIDEAGEIHPKLLSELEIRNPQGKITRQRLANYIKANQQDTLRKKMVSKYDAEARNRLIRVSPSQNLTNEKEITYHIPGIERGDDLGRHYGGKPEHEAHYSFDAAAEFELPNLDFQLLKEGDKILNVGRIQSDYSRELGGRSIKNKENQFERILDDEKIDLLADNMDASLRSFAIKVARENPQLKTADELKTKINQKIEAGKDLPPALENMKFDLDQIQTDITTIRGYNPFEAIQSAVKTAQKEFPITPYIDAKAIAALKKGLNEYNKIVPKVNELSQKELKLQDEIKATGLDLNSPSLQDSLDELSQIRKERTDLIPSDVIDKFDGFTLNKSDLEDATGKKFTESLDKSLDEIFYELETIKPGSPAVRQKYGPGTPGERALKYFNELVNNNEMTFDIGNGVKILKKATRVNTENFKGVPIDPYAKGTKTEMYKFPLRARFVEAVERGFDGFSLDSAGKRLGDEAPGDVDNKFLKPLYDQDGPNEINKMLKDLGVDPKEYVERIDARGNTPFSGTYVKIDDEIRKLVKEKGLDAFKDGGAVEDDLPDVGSITPIGPYTKPLKPDLTFGDPVINKLKKAFNFLGDVKEFILPTPKVTDPLSLVDYVTSSSAPVVAGKTAVKGLGKIDLDAEDLEEFVEWVKSSRNKFQKDRVADILKRDTKGPGKDIKNVTQNYLKENNLVDKNGNVHLYRYLNIAESNKLKPDEGLSSLTLNPEHAKMMAYKQANVTGRKLKEGEKGSVFDDMDPTSASKYEAVTMYRKPVVLEYQVPAEKIDAYLPAVFNSIDESGAGFNNLARMNVENSYSHLIDDLVDEGYDFYDAADELKGQYGLDDIYDSFDMANKESEALVDLTNIKPKNIYMDNLEIEQIANNPLIEKLEFYAGGPVGIQESLNELNKTILPNPPDVGSIKPNDLDTLIKEVGTSPVGSEGLERQAILLAMATLSMNPLQRAKEVRKVTAPLVKKLKSLHKEKQNYVENNSATQLNKYAERLNRYNRDIKSTEDRIKYVSELYDPKNYNTGGPVSIDNMLAAL